MFAELAQRLRRITSSSRFIPEVDGLRFIAIALVVLFHIGSYTREIGSGAAAPGPIASYFFWLINQGGRGVHLFFVISGFILALPFARYHMQGGPRIGLRSYFLRRLTRLEPPYIITMVACFFIMLALGKDTFAHLWRSLLTALVYLYNIFPVGERINGVAWSLEIEVQFYILVPLLTRVFALKRVWRRVLLAALVMAIPFIRAAIGPIIPTVWDYLEYFLLGLLLADLYLDGVRAQFTTVASAVIGTLLLGLIILPDRDHPVPQMLFLIGIFGFYMLALTNPLWKKIISAPALTVIGGMCYSIYLWHYVVISAIGRFTMRVFTTHDHAPMLPAFLLNAVVLIPIILAFSTIFYLLIERPCMDKDWPRKLSRRFLGDHQEPGGQESRPGSLDGGADAAQERP